MSKHRSIKGHEGLVKRHLDIWIIKQQRHNMLVFTNPKTLVPRARHTAGRHNIHALLHRNYRNHSNLNVTSITIYTEFLLFLACVTTVTGVASHSKLYRYRGHVYGNHRNPGVMSLVTMETGICGNWRVTQVTHKNYAEISTNARPYTYIYAYTHT